MKYYKLKDIQKNDNLIFDLSLDIIYKNVFLNNLSLPYIILLLKNIFNINIDYINIKNSELPNNNQKSSYSDLICNFKNTDFIIEMNRFKTNTILQKNNNYLFNLHSSKSNNKNSYGKYIYTYLLNFDKYDILNKNNLKYTSTLNFPTYNVCLYKNIKIIHINLEYLKKKYYNNSELNDLEKLLIIFIEQRKDKIRKIINCKEVEGVLRIMDQLKFEYVNGVVTYDREAFLKLEQEEYERYKKNLAKQKKRNEENKKRNEENKKRNEENKKRNEENKKRNEETKRKNEENKRSNEENKKRNEEDKKILEENKRNFDKKYKELQQVERNLKIQEKNMLNNIINKLSARGIPEHYLNDLID